MNWLREWRKRAGIDTQDDLAARLQLEGYSVGRAAVSHWENGRNPIPVDDPEFRKALSRVLKMSDAEILRAEGYDLPVWRSDAAERGASIIEQLPPEKQELAVRLLEQLLA